MFFFDLSLSGSEQVKQDNHSDRDYLCYRCKSHITSYRHIFEYPGKGSTHHFQNSFGFNFHLITFDYCENLIKVSGPSDDNTWFPPYRWIVMNCCYCNEHLGWCFIHETSHPPKFFGLIQDKLIIDSSE